MMSEIKGLVRRNILELKPYSSARSEATEAEIFLDANENPFEPAGSAFLGLNRYPEPQPVEIVDALSGVYKVDKKNLIVGRGSDEIIDCLFRVFCEPGKDKVIISPPTYGVYAVQAQINNNEVVEVPLTKAPDFKIDEKRLCLSISNKTKLIFICSPNNPVGNSVDFEVIERICKKSQGKGIVVIDEAYIEFSKRESFAKKIKEYKNAVVLRTLSKAWSMAGARLGCAIADEKIVEFLKKVIAPYPISAPSTKAVVDVLKDPEIIEKQRARVEEILREREYLKEKLIKLPFVTTVYNSDANFLLVLTNSSDEVLKKCRRSGIVIRNRDSVVPGAVRISIGTPEENELLLEALESEV
jgi:histidinol-phosphate aminotransferase